MKLLFDTLDNCYDEEAILLNNLYEIHDDILVIVLHRIINRNFRDILHMMDVFEGLMVSLKFSDKRKRIHVNIIKINVRDYD